ncbi:MAG: OmpA family protein [Cytophagaceae bacterium]|nr:OmpA family protein [Cytophagaceae bacterium]
MVDKILIGNGMRVGNIKVKGHINAIGYFESDTNIVGFNKGVVISTGMVNDISLPNISNGTSSILNSKMDNSLNKITKQKTRDVMVIEFDFVPFHNRLSFKYVFGSEEYQEWVGSPFNDVFGFFISGHGLKDYNMALLPDNKTIVSINNVNHTKNKKYYRNNDYWKTIKDGEFQGKFSFKNSFMKRLWYRLTFRPISKYVKFSGKLNIFKTEKSVELKKTLNPLVYNNLEFDGLTVPLEAWCYVKPYKKYRIKIAIGDVADAIFDSGIFLEQQSFSSTKDSLQPGFIPYKDLSMTMNWDSVFATPNSIKQPVKTPEKTTKTAKQKNEATPFFTPFSIYFALNDSSLSDTAKVQLDSLAAYLLKYSHKKCILSGRSDPTGKADLNKRLSIGRSEMVKKYLLEKGVSPKQLYKNTNPIVEEGGTIQDPKKRRVDIKVLK